MDVFTNLEGEGMKPNVLMIMHPSDALHNQITDILSGCECEVLLEENTGNGIERAQNQFFNAIVLDTKAPGMEIKQAIKILKNLDPKVKIIVTTDSTSKSFETEIRKERIFYYHIDSFDSSELILALKSALKYQVSSQLH